MNSTYAAVGLCKLAPYC